jgi:transcription initiation factor IIE alpha subunit
MDDIKNVLDQAVKIYRDYPELTWNQSVQKAKEVIENEKRGLREALKRSLTWGKCQE